MAIALARKYRPRNFASVAVQSHVSDTLKGAIARGRVAHGYLLCGPRGTGKTTLARVLAMALNCERRTGSDDGEPCGECASCQRIWSGGASLDVVEIDAASNRGVDDARELRERAMYAPSGDERYKVYIVDEAHMLTREAWNALLKILEEPPPRVVFVFATTDPQKIAQAAAPVLSRLQRFDLRRIGPAEIRERLAAVLAAEGVSAEPEALAIIARAADGGLRDALSLTDQVLSLGAEGTVTAARVRESLGLVAEDEFLAVLDMVAEGRAGDVFGAVARLADVGVDLGAFYAGVADILRAQLAVVLAGDTGDVSERLRDELRARRERLSATELLRMLHVVTDLEPRFRRSGHQQLLLETLLVRLALMDRSIEIETMLRGLAGEIGGDSPGVQSRGGGDRGGDRGGDGGGSRGGGRDEGGGGTVVRESPAGDWRAMMPPRASAGEPAGMATGRHGAAAGHVATATASGTPGPPAWEGPRPWEATSRPVMGTDLEVEVEVGVGVEVPATAERGRARPAAPGTSTASGPSGGAGAGGAEIAQGAQATGVEGGSIPDLSRVVERWGEVADRLRADGRSLLAALVLGAPPTTVTAAGSLRLEADDETAAEGLRVGQEHVLEAVRALFPGVRKLSVRHSGAGRPPERITREGMREERLTLLRRNDPSLAEAMDTLDLELLD